MQGETEGPMKISVSRASKHAPHDIAVRLPQNTFLASLWIGSGLGDPEAGQKGILG